MAENKTPPTSAPANKMTAGNTAVPKQAELEEGFLDASRLLDDLVLKNYLTSLADFDIEPLAEDMQKIDDIRMFKITEMVYSRDEYSTYKLASVFNSVQNHKCGVFIIADSDGKKTEFYVGVRSFDKDRTTGSFKETLHNALIGQFPGVKTNNLKNGEAKELLNSFPKDNVAAVSCVAQNKDSEFNDNKRYIQGLEKLVVAMQGKKYTAVVLAKSVPTDVLQETRLAYETIYTQLSPFANMQLSYGTNTALSISDALSKGTSRTTSVTTSITTTDGHSSTTTESVTKDNALSRVAGAVGGLVGTVAAVAGVAGTIASGGVAVPVTAPIVALGATSAAAGMFAAFTKKTITTGGSETETASVAKAVSAADTNGENDNQTHTEGLTTGTSDNMQLTVQNKTLIGTLERIDLQLKRLIECESLGMWGCAAYFLSDDQATAEMAAGTYKALMRGEKTGVETSAINLWNKTSHTQELRKYITSFIHPVFDYRAETGIIKVTTASLVSGNELAVHMGLPRRSVCGFPVIEHVDFGKEVVRYDRLSAETNDSRDSIELGNVYSMGTPTKTEVKLDLNSLTMHTFITGSTGAGKSNTIYEMLSQLREKKIPFLVIESAKGEYKNVFGQLSVVAVYGTNPNITRLLRINPFRFPAHIHVLEHLDRLVELFNVCWPMYAAMPAILKDAMERAYVETGWDLGNSVCNNGEKYPNFAEVLKQIEIVTKESNYSEENKGNYSGALCTRVRSLTTGLNSLVFTNDDLTDEDLFDKSVIVDLSRVGSVETKALIMGLLVMKLGEYRMNSGITDSELTHVTVLEEAHNLLRRTTAQQSLESSNIQGKSVEMLSNAIAEMRTYGEGFIIADQSPGLLDMSVIRNTNTKIILRLPEQSDRELVGFAAGLSKEQIGELTKLEQGVAAIYQNDWVEPVLVKIKKCGVRKNRYVNNPEISVSKSKYLWNQLVCLLIQGRVREQLDINIDDLEKNLNKINGLTAEQRDFFEAQIKEYKEHKELAVWKEDKFTELSQHLTDMLGVSGEVETGVLSSKDFKTLSERLFAIVRNFTPNLTDERLLTISQCLMKDFTTAQDDKEKSERIYKQWINDVKEGYQI